MDEMMGTLKYVYNVQIECIYCTSITHLMMMNDKKHGLTGIDRPSSLMRNQLQFFLIALASAVLFYFRLAPIRHATHSLELSRSIDLSTNLSIQYINMWL